MYRINKYKQYIFLGIMLINGFLNTSAQDLTGVWKGKFYSNGESLLEGTYKYEVQILHKNGGQLEGVTYSYFNTRFYCKTSFVGLFNRNNAILKENNVLDVKSENGGNCCLMTCTVKYGKQGDQEYLVGKYTSECGVQTGTVFLQRTNKTDFYKENFLIDRKPKNPITTVDTPKIKTVIKKPIGIKKLIVIKKFIKDSLTVIKRIDRRRLVQLPIDTIRQKKHIIEPIIVPINHKLDISNLDQPSVLKERINETTKILYTNADSITIDLYDNGEIDKDTVTVFHNNRLIVSAQQLGIKPITVKIAINEQNPHHEIILVANNLGDIPPNTALMVVRAGSKRYEVRIVSTEQKNAKIIFEYKK